MTPDNLSRIHAADIALRHHTLEKREWGSHNPDRDSLIDLLTDLRHWAATNGINMTDVFTISHDHYIAEKETPNP